MPIFESLCQSCNTMHEHYLRSWQEMDPPCSTCGGATQRMASRFGVPLSGSLHKYMDPKKEGADREGYWAYKTKSSISGQPEPVWLDSMEAVKEFNRAEGLSAPGEAPTNATITPDGKRIVSDGMPGNWRGCMPTVPSRVWEMNKSLTSLTGKNPTPVASGPPCTVQAVDASQMERISAEAVK